MYHDVIEDKIENYTWQGKRGKGSTVAKRTKTAMAAEPGCSPVGCHSFLPSSFLTRCSSRHCLVFALHTYACSGPVEASIIHSVPNYQF